MGHFCYMEKQLLPENIARCFFFQTSPREMGFVRTPGGLHPSDPVRTPLALKVKLYFDVTDQDAIIGACNEDKV